MARLKPFWPLGLLLAADGFLLFNQTPVAWRYGAALVLLAFLPGWAWLTGLRQPRLDLAERLTLAVGLSLALSIVAALGAVYGPGPISAAKLLIIANLLTVAGWTAGRLRHQPPSTKIDLSPLRVGWPGLVLLALLILALLLRLPRLGYAEFHEDEAEALMLGVRLLNGEDYALFLHRKGPAQMLLPLSFWLLTERITETLARWPFALSSLLSVAAIYFLGRRWFGWPAGALAALLWAINGYSIGFGRMVQYQALIFFLGPLAIYALYLAWVSRRWAWQIVAALLLAVCLLAHFDALLLLPAAAYLGWLSFRSPHQDKMGDPAPPLARLRPLLALLLFVGLLAAFYIPYILDPEFSNTAAYLAESRVKPGLLYNNLDLLRRLDRDYSSHFYLPLLIIGLISFVVWQGRAVAKGWRLALVGLGLLAATTVIWPDGWRLGDLNLAILPWLLLTGLSLWQFKRPEVRTAWLLVGAALIGYVFLVDDPRTHLYIGYPGAVILAGAGWSWVLGWLREVNQEEAWTLLGRSLSLPRLLLLAGMLSLVIGIIFYAATIFLQTETALADMRENWEDSLWERLYDDLPQAREYFGYPKREGWKAVGALRAQGHFPGDFRSIDEDFIVPIWYNYGQARSCYNTPAHFLVRTAGLEDQNRTAPDGYTEVGRIQRERETRLRIFSASAPASATPTTYSLKPLAADFDRLASPEQFTQQARPAQPVGAQFGSAIQFAGYDLETPTVAPGETLQVSLYWQALDRPPADYRAFVHLTDGTTLWGQQDDTPACRLPTSIWRVGQQGVGQFRLPVNPDTPPGRYPLVIGLYHAETLERLRISGGAGQVGDDFLWLGDIEVLSPAAQGE